MFELRYKSQSFLSRRVFIRGFLVFLVFFLLLSIVLEFIVPQSSLAAQSFYASYNTTLDADESLGSATASTSSSFPSLVSPGYGGSGQAVSFTEGQTLYYSLDNNLNPAEGQFSIKFKPEFNFQRQIPTLPGIADLYFDQESGYLYIAASRYISDSSSIVKLKPDLSDFEFIGGANVKSLATRIWGIWYDSPSQFIYFTDERYGNRVGRIKIDGTQWKLLGSYGSGEGQFNRPEGICKMGDYLYVADSYNHRLVKTGTDLSGSEWETFGSYGSGQGQFYQPGDIFCDTNTGYLYIADTLNNRIIKTKWNGVGWTEVATGVTSPTNIWYDSTSNYVFYVRNGAVGKIKSDGTGKQEYVRGDTVDSTRYDYGGVAIDAINQKVYASTLYHFGFLYEIPFAFNSRSRLLTVLSDANTQDDLTFDNPNTVQLLNSGNILVKDAGGIHEISLDKKYRRDFYCAAKDKCFLIDRSSWGGGDFIYSETEGVIYAVNKGKLYAFKMDGSFYSLGRDLPTDMLGMAYDRFSGYFYISNTHDYLMKTNFEGSSSETWGSYGSGVGQFVNPQGIWYDSSSGYLYIADTDNHRIIKTKWGGEGWTTLGSNGAGDLQFNSPRGIYYDSDSDYIYVADYNNNRIVKTKIDGTGWTVLDGFSLPFDVWYDSSSGYLYVSNYGGEGSIVKTKIDGTGWESFDGEYNQILLYGVSASNTEPRLQIDPVRGFIYFNPSFGNKSGVYVKLENLSSDWHSLDVLYKASSGQIKMVLDGSTLLDITEDSWDTPDWGSVFYIGASDTGGQWFRGKLDELAIQNIADVVPPTNPVQINAYSNSSKEKEFSDGGWGNAMLQRDRILSGQKV